MKILYCCKYCSVVFVVQTDEETCWHLMGSGEALFYVPSRVEVFQDSVDHHCIVVE